MGLPPKIHELHAYVMTMYATIDNVAQHSKLRNENKFTVIDSSDKNRTTTQIKTSEFNRFVYERASTNEVQLMKHAMP